MRVGELEEWIEATFTHRQAIQVNGGFRDAFVDVASTARLLEMNGFTADTVHIQLATQPIINTASTKPNEFTAAGADWWNTWAAVLAATALVPPIVDPVRLADILSEERRVRFCCDTNALCRGIASWLLTIMDGRASIITSAIVDRELAAWPDRHADMWKAKNDSQWLRRTQYRLAWRITETTPEGVEVDRLSPEQGALMLAKLRDEGGQKSPDADMLLIELARGVIRDQPRNARVVYLTGDRNNARAATNALGSENVLYAAADGVQAQSYSGKIVPRGWWSPVGPLGTVVIPPASRLLWNLLTACDFLLLDCAGRRWLVKQQNSVLRGGPSDWSDPWVSIEDVSQTIASPITSAIAHNATNAPATTATPASVQDSNQETAGVEVVPASGTVANTMPLQRWLLSPIIVGPSIDVSSSWRPSPKQFFPQLWAVLSAKDVEDQTPNQELQIEARKILIAFGAMTEDGTPAIRTNEFRKAWNDNNLDWFHAEFLRLPGYKSVIDSVRLDPHQRTVNRQESQIRMAKSLGQVARLSKSDKANFVGDAFIYEEQLVAALEQWLPNENDALETRDVCQFAARDLSLTPYRLEIALERLWTNMPGLPFEGRTGGTVNSDYAENIVVLGQDGYHFHPVAPGDLAFGRSGPVRFIVRTK